MPSKTSMQNLLCYIFLNFVILLQLLIELYGNSLNNLIKNTNWIQIVRIGAILLVKIENTDSKKKKNSTAEY